MTYSMPISMVSGTNRKKDDVRNARTMITYSEQIWLMTGQREALPSAPRKPSSSDTGTVKARISSTTPAARKC